MIVLQSAINFFVNINLGIGNFFGTAINLLIAGLLIHSLVKIKIFKIYLLLIIGLIYLVLFEFLLAFVLMLFLKDIEFLRSSGNIYFNIGVLGIKTLSFILLKSVLGNAIRKVDFLNKKNFLVIFMFGVFNVLIIFSVISIFVNSNITFYNNMLYFLMAFLSVFAFNIVFLFITKLIIIMSEKELTLELKQEQYSKDLLYIKSIEALLNELKIERHDYNNHMSSLYGLIKIKEYEKAEEYIDQIVEKFDLMNHIIDVNSIHLSSMLNFMFSLAKKKHIKLNSNVKNSINLDRSFVDINNIISNLLNNAIEATENLPEDERIIDFEINNRNNYLIIKITNHKSNAIILDNQMIQSGFTTKQDKKNHGLGLMSIKRTVKKYNGLIEIIDKGKIFEVNIGILSKYL